MARVTAFFSLLLVAGQALAESQYFVVLGSYDTMSRADQAKATAAQRLPEPYSVSAADTPAGIYYRVVAGPYFRKDQAAGVQDQARTAGFADAWVLAESSPVSGGYPALDTLATETDEVEDRLLYGTGAYDAPTPEPAGDGDDASSEEEDDGPILVEEAPPGYELHRLQRSDDS